MHIRGVARKEDPVSSIITAQTGTVARSIELADHLRAVLTDALINSEVAPMSNTCTDFTFSARCASVVPKKNRRRTHAQHETLETTFYLNGRISSMVDIDFSALQFADVSLRLGKARNFY